MNNWKPNYNEIFAERAKRYNLCITNDMAQVGARKYYKNNYIAFIEDWCITIDPRNAGTDKATLLPFILFPIQKKFCDCLYECVQQKENMLCEKSRDMGVTWLACAMSVWFFLFYDNASIGWGSRKEALVDRIGDPDSIFEKIRKMLSALPFFLLPYKFNLKTHSGFMKIRNPDNNSVITGEAGDNIGRGGRSLLYFKDESAHYSHPESIEAALGDNTNTQVDISSVNGTNNVFYHKRQSGELWDYNKKIAKGITRIIIMDWREHPLKNKEWYENRRAKAEREGTLHLFYQEVDRDYRASIEGIIIRPELVEAAIDAHKVLNFKSNDDNIIAALDVADEGADTNAMAFRQGPILIKLKEWTGQHSDVAVTAQKSLSLALLNKVSNLQYDCIGIGAGVKSEFNRLSKLGKNKNNIKIVGWNAASSPLYKTHRVVPGDNQSPKNKDFFKNLKIQAWWNLRIRFEKTYRSIRSIKDKSFKAYDPSELISISTADMSPNMLFSLKNELSQPVLVNDPNSGKLKVDKKPNGTKSPNLADAVVMAYYPIMPRTFRVWNI